MEPSGIGDVVVLAERFQPTEPILDKFERCAASVDGAIALMTPDDVGRLHAETAATELQARQNAWIEGGWFCAISAAATCCCTPRHLSRRVALCIQPSF